jgi:hypothetical protein
LIHTKTIVLPGDTDVINTADHVRKPGEAEDTLHPEKTISIVSMVKQTSKKMVKREVTPATAGIPATYVDEEVVTQGFDEQLFVIQIVYRLGLLTHPDRVVNAFYENYAPFSLERERGSWGERIRKCKEKGNAGVVKQILDVVAGRCDEVLSRQDLSLIISDERERANTELTDHLLKKGHTTDDLSPLEELGVELSRAAIPDIKDVHENGWIASNSSATRNEQHFAAQVRITDAKRESQLAQASAQQDVEVRKTEAEKAIATARTAALEEKIKAGEKEAVLALQPLFARLKAVTDQRDAMVINSMLVKLDSLSGTDIAAITQAATNAFGKPPETLVTLGGQVLDAHPVTAFVNALRQLFPQFFPPAPPTP